MGRVVKIGRRFHRIRLKMAPHRVSAFFSSIILVFFFSAFVCGDSEKPPILRMITWNVADNSDMEEGFDDGAIDKLLGVDELEEGQQPADIFAVGLQEQCWQCNEDEMMDIPRAFLNRLHLHGLGPYEVIGVEGTRESGWCELGCKLGTHGTTALFVLAKQGLILDHKSFHHNDGCSDRFPENDEKGVAYMKLLLSSGSSVCVATSHLESRNPAFRRQCLKEFFADANKNMKWSSDCDYQFLSGDFNTRTSASSLEGQNQLMPAKPDLMSLKSRDEMKGSVPFGTDDEWSGNLLDYINSIQSATFKESTVNFPPTYKVVKAENCEGRRPCYRTNRPKSWTDRVLHTAGSSQRYDSFLFDFADHYPVFEDFELS